MGSVDIVGPLFQPLRLGALSLSHRVVQAPCTRMRSTKESEGVFVPNDLNVEYYSQRASAGGFMLTEATPISRYVCSLTSQKRFPTDLLGGWISRGPRNFHQIADRGLEEGHRRSTREGCLHLLSAVACRSCDCSFFH
jgi:hypothetical protein